MSSDDDRRSVGLGVCRRVGSGGAAGDETDATYRQKRWITGTHTE
jgi:hypothetical protein